MKITIMNMSGVYEYQTFYQEYPNIYLDLENVPGTNCYCDDAARTEIRQRLEESGAFDIPIHWLDSGNYHYLSLLYMERIQEDFALALFDNHPDMQQPAFGNVTSCGGWVLEALERMPHLKAVYVYGVENELIRACEPLNSRVHILRSWETNAAGGQDGASGTDILRTQGCLEQAGGEHLPIYISVDKDVLREGISCCNWSQGVTTEEQLLEEIQAFQGRRFLGMDFCGESGDQADDREQKINNALNKRLAEFAVKTCQHSFFTA